MLMKMDQNVKFSFIGALLHIFITFHDLNHHIISPLPSNAVLFVQVPFWSSDSHRVSRLPFVIRVWLSQEFFNSAYFNFHSMVHAGTWGGGVGE